ncbi:MAG TPA: ABC transporter permease [Polyangiaceae bacterium]|nr:ABC transporter permease [Polyangiaceae bacterium]
MLRILLTAVPLALHSIVQWPLRAALTAFGILIGVAAVVVTVALGEGTEIAVRQKLELLGQNTLSVFPQQTPPSGVEREGYQPRLTEADGLAIVRESPSVLYVAPILASRGETSFGGYTLQADFVGTNRAFSAIRNWPLASGELWLERTESTGARECLIGVGVARELFGDEDPVGRVLRLGQHPFRVIGVLAEKGPGPFGQEQDNIVLMPIAAMRAKLRPTPPGRVDQLLVQARDAGSVDGAKRELGALLRQRHGLWEGVEDDFAVRSDEGFRETQDRIVGVLRSLLTSIAAVSLLVGGIGIMNIMLVSVSERTRDIGVRMAIGATRWDILIQFLTESVLLSVFGGMLGAALSVVAVAGLAGALSLPMQPSFEALGVALAVSSAIGVCFGIVPSWRAASLDPIAALGRE